MALSNELISQFVKITKDTNDEKKSTEVTGTVVQQGDKYYLRLDGNESDRLIPFDNTIVEAIHGDRVTINIKDHQALVTGNLSSPAVRSDTVKDLNLNIKQVQSSITQTKSTIDQLKSSIDQNRSSITQIDTAVKQQSTKINQNKAAINQQKVTIDQYNTIINQQNTKIDQQGSDITVLNSAFTISDGVVTGLKGIKINEADINFASIGTASINELLAKSSIIGDAIVDDQTVTGKLVGVEINADLITAGTIVADRLALRGEDGLYHRINNDALGDGLTEEELAEKKEHPEYYGVDGSAIIAKTIAANKIAVTDLVSFGATIGGFSITDSSIHTFAKDSVDNTIPGVYFDNDGQFAVGDAEDYIKLQKQEYTENNFNIQNSQVGINATVQSNENNEIVIQIDDSLLEDHVEVEEFPNLFDLSACGTGRNTIVTSNNDGSINVQLKTGEVMPNLFDIMDISTYEIENDVEINTKFEESNGAMVDIVRDSTGANTRKSIVFELDPSATYNIELINVRNTGLSLYDSNNDRQCIYDSGSVANNATISCQITGATHGYLYPISYNVGDYYTFSNMQVRKYIENGREETVLQSASTYFEDTIYGDLDSKIEYEINLDAENCGILIYGLGVNDPPIYNNNTGGHINFKISGATRYYIYPLNYPDISSYSFSNVVIREPSIEHAIPALSLDSESFSIKFELDDTEKYTVQYSSSNCALNMYDKNMNKLYSLVDNGNGIDTIIRNVKYCYFNILSADESNLYSLSNVVIKQVTKYNLDISASNIRFGPNKGSLSNYVNITSENNQPCMELGNSGRFKVKITNTEIDFMDGDTIPAKISNDQLEINNANVRRNLRFGGFLLSKRTNGNVGFSWIGTEGDDN